jgi:hypothetical protein
MARIRLDLNVESLNNHLIFIFHKIYGARAAVVPSNDALPC